MAALCSVRRSWSYSSVDLETLVEFLKSGPWEGLNALNSELEDTFWLLM